MYKYVEVTPHFFTAQCEDCAAANFTYPTRDCVSAGRYCAPTMDRNPDTIRSGIDVIMENMRI